MSIAAHSTEGPGIPVLTLPRTLQAVRAALSDDERARLAGELETGDVIEVFGRWWNVASMRTSPAVADAVARYRAGGQTVPIEDVAAALRRSA
jgi:hypothetical protein